MGDVWVCVCVCVPVSCACCGTVGRSGLPVQRHSQHRRVAPVLFHAMADPYRAAGGAIARDVGQAIAVLQAFNPTIRVVEVQPPPDTDLRQLQEEVSAAA